MKPVETLMKSMRREQLIFGLGAAVFLFAAGIIGFAVELHDLNPAARQALPMCYAFGLIGICHSLTAIRFQSVLKLLSPDSQSAESK